MKKVYIKDEALNPEDTRRKRVIDFGDELGQMEFVATDEQTREILARIDPERIRQAARRG